MNRKPDHTFKLWLSR